MEKVSVCPNPGTVVTLQRSFFLFLFFMWISGKTFIQEEIPNLLSFAVSVEGLVLSITYPAKLLVDARRLGSVALAE